MYVRSAPGCKPDVSLMDFVPMKEYVSVTGENLYHTSMRTFLKMYLPDSEYNVDTDINQLEEDTLPFINKMIGISADGAAVNFGLRKRIN